MEEGRIRVTFPGKMRVDADYKGFLIKTDQPRYAGGEGQAPSPFDLFLASIATCAGYYVLAFSKQRGISLEGASVLMETEKNAETKMIDKISIRIELPPGFPDKYRDAVIRAVDSCTVKVHILKPPSFKIEAEISK